MKAIKLTDKNFNREVLPSSKPVLVDIFAHWCNPCKTMLPRVYDAAKEFKGKAKVYTLDFDKNPKKCAQYKIKSIPTLLLFKNGHVVERITGIISKRELFKLMEKHIPKEKIAK